MSLKSFKAIALLLFLAFFVSSITFVSHAENPGTITPVVQQTDQAAAALREGRRLMKRGHSDQALIQFRNALNLYTNAKNSSGMAASYNELGDFYLRQGQYQIALDNYQKALDGFLGVDVKRDVVNAAVGVADDKYNANLMLAKIGDVNFRLGKTSEAMSAYGRMVVKKPEGAASKVGRRFGGLGAIAGGISTGNVSVAAPTSALTVALEAKKELDEYRVSIVYSSYELGMGRIAYSSNDLESAKKHFENALEASGSTIAGIAKLGQVRRFRAAARTSLGDVALRQGKYKDASKYYADAKKGAQDDKRLDLIWPAQRGLGRALWLQAVQEKDPKKSMSLRESAMTNYRESIATIETLREGSLRADESRTTFLATTKDVYDEASNAFAEMALMNAAGSATLSGKALDSAAKSFRTSEGGRSRSLLDLLGEVNAQITEGFPADLLKRKQENLDRQQLIAEQLTGIALSAEVKDKPSDLEKELDKLQTEFDQIENQIRAASPKYAALTAAQPLTLADVQQKVLDDSTVLLEYELGADNSFAFAVTRTSVSLFKLPRRTDVDKLATDFRAQLIPAKLQRRIVGIDVAADQQRGFGIVQGPAEDLAPFVAASNALYKAAVEPAAAMIADKRILVVADGALNYVPFEALVKNSDGADYASLNYLVKTNEIVYSPSSSVIAAIRANAAPSGKNILLVADPVFSADDPRAKGTGAAPAAGEPRGLGLGLEAAVDAIAGAAASGPRGLARLTGTRTEAEEIAKIAKGGGAQADLWTALNANEDNVRTRDMSTYRYLHVATHGLLDAERPQFTGVVLSLVGNKTNDGFLRTDEIFNLKLGAPLVMLSACETGLGKEKRRGGVIGLTRAVMY